jgi:hypothetical protein
MSRILVLTVKLRYTAGAATSVYELQLNVFLGIPDFGLESEYLGRKSQAWINCTPVLKDTRYMQPTSFNMPMQTDTAKARPGYANTNKNSGIVFCTDLHCAPGFLNRSGICTKATKLGCYV